MKRTTSRPAPAPRSPSARRQPPDGPAPLAPSEFPCGTVALARALIGALLVRRREGELLIGRIVETEAYVAGDPASHSFRGPTPRNRAMFGPPLHAYVYFIYGTNWCLNVTSEADGVGAAVLIRACEPLRGQATMHALRGRPELSDAVLARGPGNLCRAFGIGPEFDGVPLTGGAELWLAAGGAKVEVGVSTRIGITRAAHEPMRFYARGSRSVSGPRALSP